LEEKHMRINNSVTSLVLFSVGAVVTALGVFLLTSVDGPTLMNALRVTSNPGIEMLQAIPDAGMAIMGLAIGAGLALGLAGVGAGLGMGTASAAALGAITEKPETFGKSILYVVFIEAVAIYGFVIAFLLLGQIPLLIG
jgi:F0F1-type ATP synthase membrane subunit c/vacuolar-type H+-ATPase subunit K